MTILESLKLYTGGDVIKELKQNMNGFDFTELEIEDIIEAIKPALESRDNWVTFGPVSVVGFRRCMCKVKYLKDQKIYPNLLAELEINIPGQKCCVVAEFNPFECEEVRGDYVYARATGKVNNLFRKFMREKFGNAYVEANNNFWNEVKENGVEEVLNKATKEIQEITDGCNENLISL